jgi:Uma2 family endonuclease
MVEATQEQVIQEQIKEEEAAPPTLEAYLDAYARQPVEVVDGDMVVMSPPEFRHVRIAHTLYHLLHAFASKKKLGSAWIEAPYLLDADDRADWVRGSRVSDVSFVARERMDAHLARHGTEGPLRLAPDLAVEIVSTHDRYSDLNRKVADYLRYGTRLVWVIDPQVRTVRVVTPDDPGGRILTPDDTLAGDPVLPGWSAPVLDVLGGPAESPAPAAAPQEEAGE